LNGLLTVSDKKAGLFGIDDRADFIPHSCGRHAECVSTPEIEITPQTSQTVILKLDKLKENVTLLLRVCQVATDGSECCFRSWDAGIEPSNRRPNLGLQKNHGSSPIFTMKNQIEMTMPAPKNDFYSRAHLLVAAIRIFEHVNTRPPNADELCRSLQLSVEQGSFICRKLEELGIIEAVESSYGTRWFIRNHLKIEEIPRGEEENKLGEEIKKFQDTQKALAKKIESFQAKQQQKKKDLFAEMEKKLKEELHKK
jgi:hypothetical protein